MPGGRILLQVLFNCHKKNVSLLRIYKHCPCSSRCRYCFRVQYTYSWLRNAPIPVVARSKVWVSVRSLAGIAGSNSDGFMAVCLLRVLCVVRWRTLRRGDHSSRRVLPNVVRLSEIVKA